MISNRHGSKGNPIFLNGNDLTIPNIIDVVLNYTKVRLAEDVNKRIFQERELLMDIINNSPPIYGVTRGVGANRNIVVPMEQITDYQTRILLSHCVNVGPYYPENVVRAIMIVRANSLAKGGSGVQPCILNLLIDMLNHKIHPLIPSKGSLGTGDLGSMAEMGLALTGRGEVYYKNKKLKAIEAFKLAGLQPIILGPKDGLILCSNNSASLGHAAILIDRYASVLDHANLAYALSLEAFRGNINPLHPKLNEFRPHKGQTCTTEDILCYLEDSYLWEEDVKRGVQDPISFRSSVQVHGACKDIYNFVLDGINIEINSIGDNPLLLSTENKLISHGNFHIGTIAMRFDFLAIQSSSLANMIQNRIQRIMTPEFSGLPIFLTENPGLSNGFSTLQKSYTYFAAEIRHLANPGSLDALNVANSVEDHAAMTAFVVQKMEQIIENLERIIGIELMVASQAIDILNNPKLGKGTEVAYRNLRSYIPKLEEDRQLRQDIEIAHQLIKKRVILNEVGKLKKGIKLNPNF